MSQNPKQSGIPMVRKVSSTTTRIRVPQATGSGASRVASTSSGIRPPAAGLRPSGSQTRAGGGLLAPVPRGRASSSGTAQGQIPRAGAPLLRTTTTTVRNVDAKGGSFTNVATSQAVIPGSGRSGGQAIARRIGGPAGRPVSAGNRASSSRQTADEAVPGRALQQQMSQAIKLKTRSDPNARITVKQSKKSTGTLGTVPTPAGEQPIVEQVVVQQTVERTEGAEQSARTVTSYKRDLSGRVVKSQMGIMQRDPNYGLKTNLAKEVISATSTVSVTQDYVDTKRDVVHEVTKMKTPLGDVDISQIAQLIEEEKEDVKNTLQISPPALTRKSPETLGLKKRLQKLKLEPENMALLEQSVTRPTPTADEAPSEETPPEVIASIMHTTEKYVPPQASPVQVFNTLFVETNDNVLNVSSVAPGPLGDVVVPVDNTTNVLQEPISKEMENVTLLIHTTDAPPDDAFVKAKPKEPKRRVTTLRPVETLISAEPPPWNEIDLRPLSETVGAAPIDEVEPANISELDVKAEMRENGIEYFLEADPIQYINRIQLRGSQMPPWFPGYMIALPDIPNSVDLGRSPSEVMLTAWRTVQPSEFPDDSIIAI